MLVYNNGGPSGYGGGDSSFRYGWDYSRVIEFNPVNLEIVWQYGSADGDDFFYSSYVSNGQRLPNGNTLITIGTSVKVIEVTSRKQIV